MRTHSRFDDGCETSRGALRLFIADFPLTSMFVVAVFGAVIGNLVRVYFL